MTPFGDIYPASCGDQPHRKPAYPHQSDAGLTLIDLLLVAIILAVLSMFAEMPLNQLLSGQRYTYLIERLETTLARARNEAVLQGITTTVCQSRGGGPSPQCGNGNEWNEGWILFVDEDGDGRRSPDELILERIDPGDDKTTISFNNRSQSYITFKASGLTSQFGSFNFCNREISKTQQRIVVSIMGLTRQDKAKTCPG